MVRRLILIALLSLFAVAEIAPALVTSAYAQEQPKKRNLMLRGDGMEKSAFEGRVPERVGFFELLENTKPVLRGATHFADTREADFREAKPLDTVEQRRWEAALKQTEADPWMPMWMLLLLGCILTAWAWRQRGAAQASSGPLRFPSPQTPSPAH